MEFNGLPELLKESIQLELNVAELYRIFSMALPEDNGFWWQLYQEEKSHAILIRAARDSQKKRGKFPDKLVASSIEDLQQSNAKVTVLIKQFRTTPPTRKEACRIAIELENESGELHFTRFMEKSAENSLETVFQQLNRGDIEHEKRIRAHGLSIGLSV